MKRDLYRFAKARRNNEKIILIELEWYRKFNKNYNMNTNTVR